MPTIESEMGRTGTLWQKRGLAFADLKQTLGQVEKNLKVAEKLMKVELLIMVTAELQQGPK